MKLKKQKHLSSIFAQLDKDSYRFPPKILLTPSFITKFNTQKHSILLFDSINIKKPNLCISRCAYKKYKGDHKNTNSKIIKEMSNHEKKLWNKNRFLNDLIRYCTIKKCEHESYEFGCGVDICSRKKYMLAYDVKEFTEPIEDIPNIKLIRGELKLEYNKKQVD